MNRRDFASMVVGTLLTVGAFFCSTHFSSKDEYTRLSLSVSPAVTPLIEAKIGNTDVCLLLDLGSHAELKLDLNPLTELKKRPKGLVHSRDIKGNHYYRPSYILPEIEIGSLKYRRVLAEQESEEFHKNTALSQTENQKPAAPSASQGTLGIGLLKKKVLFFNFPNKVMVICNRLEQLEREGIFPNRWHKIPLKVSSNGIFLLIETDLGTQRFCLDTGSTLTVIRTPQLEDISIGEKEYGLETFVSSRFTLAEKKFGPKKLYLLDFSPDLLEDGILGMDFLSRHRIVLDLPHQTAYIEPVIQ